MGGVSSKPAQAGTGTGTGGAPVAGPVAQRSDWRTWMDRLRSRGTGTEPEGKTRDGRGVRLATPAGTVAGVKRAAGRVDPDALRSASSTPRPVALPPLNTGASTSVTPPSTHAVHQPFDRKHGVSSAPSPRLTGAQPAVQPITDAVPGLARYTPAQAAEWIEDQADVLGRAGMDDENLQLLCLDIQTAASTLSPVHLQAMGRALAQVFNPASLASSSQSSQAVYAAALAGPTAYAGLRRLMTALLAHPAQALSPAQAGAFVQGMRLSLPPQREGADAVFRRTICEAQQAGAPPDTVIAMTCGWISAMVDPTHKAVAYTPARLPPGFKGKSEALQAAMDLGKRLALNPASVFSAQVQASRDKRFEWVMLAYQMPKPQSNERRLPDASRNYTRRVFPLLTPHQKLQLLTAYNQTRHLGPLRDAKAEGKAS